MSHHAFGSMLAGIALFVGANAHAGMPAMQSLAVSDTAFGNPVPSFSPDTPRLFLHAALVDMPAGSRLSSVWIASDTNGVAPPNYKLETVELTTDATDVATFAVNKPADGWPAGSYIVDLFINGTSAYKVQFNVRAP